MTTVESILAGVNQVNSTGKYSADWDTMKGYPVPQWYLDGKFGIFIHWGLYCVPGFGNEWYPRNMYQQGTPEYEHHVATYGPQAQFGYKDFIPQLTAEKYDPAQWAELFKKAGARFVVPVAEHHDGFAMYDSALSEWTAAKMGPKRDLMGELADAVRRAGLVFGLSSHRAEHWWFMNGGRKFESDVQDAQYQDFYGPAVVTDGEPGELDSKPAPDAAHLDNWLARTCELIDRYQPQLIWFDWWIGHEAFKPYLPRFAAYYYNRAAEWGQGVAVNYKFKAFPADTAVLDIERGQLKDIRPFFWQNDTSVSKNSWGYIHNHDYRTTESIVHDLVDIVSKNGALLLNIGPKPDGTIPEPEQKLLLETGEWLAVNGEAIYNTRPWKVYGEGPTEVPEGSFTDTKRAPFTGQDWRFTTRGDVIYAICLGWPGAEAKIVSLGMQAAMIQRVNLLGVPGELEWSQDDSGLTVVMPVERPCEHAWTLRIESM